MVTEEFYTYKNSSGEVIGWISKAELEFRYKWKQKQEKRFWEIMLFGINELHLERMARKM